MSNEETHCGFVALIGAPNAGKSTLLNAFVGAKVAIVTHKVQTTRTRISGMTIRNASQIIFVDTPGIFAKPKRRLERAMVETAWKVVHDSDLVVLVVDAKVGITDAVSHILEQLGKRGITTVLALNKVDKTKKPDLLTLSEKLNQDFPFEETFMISALNEGGVDDLFDHLARAVPEGSWLYPEDQMTDVSQRYLASEMTREQIFLNLHQELPYSIAVETTDWKKQADGSLRIEQNILCERENHKAMVIGKGGSMLKKVGAASRAELEKFLGRKVHLFLFVKVSPDWSERPHHYREIGLEFVE